jgi:maltose alpha-D-glucosyltransferase/alpha-amylase
MNTLAELLDGPLGSHLEREVLPAWLPRRRWFRSKARSLKTVTLEARLPLGESGDIVFCVLRVAFDEGPVERYALPLALITPDPAASLPEDAVLTPVPTAAGTRALIDACWNTEFRAHLFDLLSGTREFQNKIGTLRGLPSSSAVIPGTDRDTSALLSAEQSNTSFVYGGKTFVKLYRRLEEGVHPEPEMLRFLREHTDYRGVPAFLSALAWTPARGEKNRNTVAASVTVALAQEFVPGGVNAWDFAVETLRANRTPPAAFLAWVTLLGRRIAALHAALASRPDLPAFAPEPLTAADIEAARSRARASLDAALTVLAGGMKGLSPETAALARTVLDNRARLENLLRAAGSDAGSHTGSDSAAGMKIRTHGDLHLGQVLTAGGDIRILDFEGEPGRALAEARAKQFPWRDVAGMLRSFHYAAHVAAHSGGERAEGRADLRADSLTAAFLSGYRDPQAVSQGRDLLRPAAGQKGEDLLPLFMLEKAAYELLYECNNRPTWAHIPLRGLVTFCNDIGKNG